MNIDTKKTIVKWIVSILTITAASLAALFGLNSCNVTRTITTSSQYYQKGDTTTVIQTKTIESYDATKKTKQL